VEKFCRAGQATEDNMPRAGYLRLQIHTQDMQYLSLFHYTNAPTILLYT